MEGWCRAAARGPNPGDPAGSAGSAGSADEFPTPDSVRSGLQKVVYETPNKPVCMYLRHKNKGSLFIENRRCIFGGKKAPAGAPLVALSLTSTCFMSLRQTSRFSIFQKYNILHWKNLQICLRPQIGLLTRFSDEKCKN